MDSTKALCTTTQGTVKRRGVAKRMPNPKSANSTTYFLPRYANTMIVQRLRWPWSG